MQILQREMEGEAKLAGLDTDQSVVDMVKDLRKES